MDLRDNVVACQSYMKAIPMKNITLILFTLLIASSLFSCATAQNSPTPKKPMPYIMESDEGILLNTFSLGQGDFPVLHGLEALPQEPEYTRLSDEIAIPLINKYFRKAGFKPKSDYSFNYGKIQFKLDGFDQKNFTGFVYISKDDYEEPIIPPNSSGSAKGLFYTRKSPERVSVPELLLFEQLAQQERIYLAMINAHQFSWKTVEGEAGKQLAIKRLEARIKLYIRWVLARIEIRTSDKRQTKK